MVVVVVTFQQVARRRSTTEWQSYLAEMDVRGARFDGNQPSSSSVCDLSREEPFSRMEQKLPMLLFD